MVGVCVSMKGAFSQMVFHPFDSSLGVEGFFEVFLNCLLFFRSRQGFVWKNKSVHMRQMILGQPQLQREREEGRLMGDNENASKTG